MIEDSWRDCAHKFDNRTRRASFQHAAIEKGNSMKDCLVTAFLGVLLLIVNGSAIMTSTRTDLTKPPPTTVSSLSGLPKTEAAYGKNKIPYFLPTGRLRLQLSVNEKTQECEIKVTEVYLTDTSQLFFAEYQPSVLSEDTVTITTEKSGLLKKIETKTKDQTLAIIVSLIDIAKAVMGIPTPLTKTLGLAPCILDRTFDPFDKLETAAVISLLKNIDISPRLTDLAIDQYGSAGNVNDQWYTPPPIGTKGIFHRPLLPYKFTVKTDTDAVQSSTVVYLPNQSPILSVDISRAPFVENQYSLMFADGILTEIKWIKPSEFLGFLNIPLNIAKAIASIPNELLTVKVTDLNAEKGVLEGQKNLLQAQLDLIKKQRELEEAQSK
jgi:hypothetical protein